MSARHVSFPNSNSFSSAVTGPTKRLVYVSALGAAEDSFRSNGINTTIGRGTEKLDTDDYNNYNDYDNNDNDYEILTYRRYLGSNFKWYIEYEKGVLFQGIKGKNASFILIPFKGNPFNF